MRIVEWMIYVMAEVGLDGGYTPFVKIGYVAGRDRASALPMLRRRLNKLQVGNPRRLHVIGLTPGTRKDEKALHYRFQEHRVKRPSVCEWIHLHADVASWLETVRVEPIVCMQAVGIGARGGSTEARTCKAHCSMCGEAGHSRPRCPRALPRPAPLWISRRPTIGTDGTPKLKRGQWVWRGRVRTSWTG